MDVDDVVAVCVVSWCGWLVVFLVLFPWRLVRMKALGVSNCVPELPWVLPISSIRTREAYWLPIRPNTSPLLPPQHVTPPSSPKHVTPPHPPQNNCLCKLILRIVKRLRRANRQILHCFELYSILNCMHVWVKSVSCVFFFYECGRTSERLVEYISREREYSNSSSEALWRNVTSLLPL